ncbi:MAG: prepilin-type N-terminal cleavage/methylation domain-containing protein [Rhodospirillaceae bacterium]|nr:prepilin-type N-terminal cleavage/methylation domain-containing protein [Rhodospirillaceae bacterium]
MVKFVSPASGGQKGFTLIEMSIVLVIIGLIIGGILKGQEVIANARAKATINQMNAQRSAVNTYFDRYRALPGDDAQGALRVDARLVAGNGDGIVGVTSGATAALLGTANGTTLENYQYFKALLAANLLNGGEITPVATITGATFGVNSSLPTSPVSGAGVTVMYGGHDGDSTASTLRTAHWYRLHKTPAPPAAALSPREMAAIDNAADDGLPGSGGVRASPGAACYVQAANAIYALSDNIGCIGYFEAHP